MAQTEVASDWALIPSGLGAGDSFRLLIVTSTRQTAESSTIGDYDTVVQDDVSSNGHMTIQSYSANFKMLGCTSTTNAQTNTNTGSSDTAAPIYWLNGAKVADNYADLYDGSWDSNAPKYPSGENAPDSGHLSRMFIGCLDNGTKSANTLGDGTVSSGYPGVSGFELSSSVAVNTNILRYYGLSEIFQVASGSNTTPAVDSIAFSSAGADNTFAIGDAVSATVTFSAAVTVTGTLQLEIDVGGRPTALDYSSGSGTTALVFTGYTVAANDEDANGLSIAANKLTLNSGTIKASAGDNPDAVLDHAAVAASANHKVDGIRPTLVTTGNNAPRTSTDGTKIILTFSEDVDISAGHSVVTFYTVMIGGTAATVDSIDFPTSHTSFALILASTDTVAVGDTVTVALMPDAVLDDASNGNATLAATSVFNTVVTLPGKPTGLTVGAVTPTKIPLSWTAPTNAGGYSVERAPDVSGSAGTWAAVWSGNVTSYTDTGLTPGTKYHYRVSGINSGGTGAASDSVSGTTAALPVVTITAQNATVTEGSRATFIISRTGYDVERISVLVTLTATGDMGITTGSRTFTLFTGTAPATYNANSTGDAVDEENGSVTARLLTDSDGVIINGYTIGTPASATVTVEDDDTVPGTPIVSAQGLDTKLVLNWPMPAEGTSSITGYDYRYKTTAGAEATWSTWTDTGLSGSDASNDFEITGLTNGTDYTVEVRAKSDAGTSLEGSANATPTPPPMVSSVAITSDPGADNTYAIDDDIAVTFTFDKNITLSGGVSTAPYIYLNVGTTEREVGCTVGTAPTMVLVCTYTVAVRDEDNNGVNVGGGTIQQHARNVILGPLGQRANVQHQGLSDNSGHKVDGVRPTVVSAEASGDSLTIKFSEALDEDSTPATSAFTLNVDSGTAPTISSVDIDGSNVTLSLSAAVDTSKTYTIDYAAPMTSPIKDLVGNAAEDVSTQSVSTEDTTAPELTEATTLSSNAVLLSYDEVLDPNSVPDKSQFTVKVGESARTLSTVGSHGTMGIRLSLGSTFRPGDMLTVSYAVPSTNPIQDAASNDAVGFTDEAVTNNLAATAPDAPGNLAASPGTVAGTMALTWETPWHNGNAITRFEVRYAAGTSVPAATTWTAITGSGASTTSHTVTGLTAGTEYTFEVHAVNGIDNGAEASVTETVLAPVWEFTLTDSSNNNVTELTEGGDSATATVRITNGVTFGTDQTVNLKWGATILDRGFVLGAGNATTITILAGESSGTLEISAPELGGTDVYSSSFTQALKATHGGTEIGSIDLTYVDDEPVPVATISMAPTTVDEGENIEIQITLATVFAGGATINFAVTDADNALSGTLPTSTRFSGLQVTKTVTLTTDDNTTQNDGAREVTFALALNSSFAYTLGTTSSVTVEVLDNDTPPTVPRNLMAEARLTEVDLTWQAPATDHGQPLTYEYRQKEGTGPFGDWTAILNSDIDTTDYTVTGLTSGADYTFEVRAENVGGKGDEASVTVTTLAPEWELTLTDSDGNAVTQLTEGGDPATATVRITNGVTFTTAQTVTLEWDGLALDAGSPIQGAGGASEITIPPGTSSGTLVISAPDPGGVAAYDRPRTAPLWGRHGATRIGGIDLTFSDDEEPPMATLTAVPAQVSEGEGIEVEIRLSLPYGGNATSTLQLIVTDAAGALAAPLPTEVQFDAGELTHAVTLTAADNAVHNDGARVVTVALAPSPDASLYTLGAPSSATVVVTDNDNVAPVFSDGASATRSVAENTAAGENVGAALTATDTDAGDTLTYTLEGADAASFDIVSTSGQIRTRPGVTYDHEARSSYSVTVKADAGNAGTATVAVTITVTDVAEPPAAPGAPTVTATSASTTSLDVTWTAPANPGKPAISGYDLRYRAGTSGSWTDGPQNRTGASASIASLAAGTPYQVQVRATNAEGDGPWSASGTGSTGTSSNTAPTFANPTATRSVPENSAADTNVGAVVTATDTDAGDTLTYTLEGADAASFDIVSTSGQIRTRPGVTYDHEARSSYSVTVKADDGNAGTATVAVTITVTDVAEPPAAPAAPTVTATSASTTSLDVTWTAPANSGKPAISGYDLRYRAGISGSWTDGPQNRTGASASIASLTAGTSYQVQVRATNAEGDGPWSASGTGSTGTSSNTAPDAPRSLTAEGGNQEVTLRWLAPASNGGSAILRYQYRRRYGSQAYGNWTDIANSAPGAANANSYTVTGLLGNAQYRFEVRAVNTRGPGAESNEVVETPAPVTKLRASQKAWMARFDRTVATQVVDAIGARFSGGGNQGVTVGGQSLNRAGGAVDEALARDRLHAEPGEPGAEPKVLSMDGRELLLGSSFSFGGGGKDGAPSWGAWGRFATGGFEADADGMRVEGDVTTGLLGADASRGRWLAGVAVSLSRGEGPFRLTSAMESNRLSGTVESSLTALYPYAKLGLSDRMEAWGLVGLGTGELTVREGGGRPIETDLGMTMGAVGTRGRLLSADEGGGLDLALRSDAMWVRMKSDAVSGGEGNLAAAQALVSRLRLIVEGSRTFAMADERTITPRGEVGVRHDLGDAETGAGLEVGAGVKFAGDGFSIEGAVRALVAHEDAHYREWGASGAIRVDPGAAGRGLSLSIAPTWGNAASAAARLWSARDAGGLVRADDFEAKSRLEAELGYGVGAPHGPGLVTPYAGLTLSDGARRALRTGVRWNASQSAAVSLEASREAQGSGEALTLRAEVRW